MVRHLLLVTLLSVGVVAEALAAFGYHDVTFEVFGGTYNAQPDPGGRAAWVDALPHVTDLRLAALLASSTEAFHRAQAS